jgi:hypothetical protein
MKLYIDKTLSDFGFTFNVQHYSMAARRSQRLQAKGRRSVGAERALGKAVQVDPS